MRINGFENIYNNYDSKVVKENNNKKSDIYDLDITVETAVSQIGQQQTTSGGDFCASEGQYCTCVEACRGSTVCSEC